MALDAGTTNSIRTQLWAALLAETWIAANIKAGNRYNFEEGHGHKRPDDPQDADLPDLTLILVNFKHAPHGNGGARTTTTWKVQFRLPYLSATMQANAVDALFAAWKDGCPVSTFGSTKTKPNGPPSSYFRVTSP